jgi:serine protease Do
MNHTFRPLGLALSLAAILPILRAADDAVPAPKQETRQQLRVIATQDKSAPGVARTDRRVMLVRPDGSGEIESVTFLGVETAPVSPTLTAQLGLADGTGLVIAQVALESPAAGVLKEHDVLLKLDDQLLIEQRQLSVLLRNHKEGDEITLTYLRGGKQATVRVKLAKHDVPKLSMQSGSLTPGGGFGGGTFWAGSPSGNFDVMVTNPSAPQERGSVERMLPLLGGAKAPGLRIFSESARSDGGPGENNISVRVNTGNSHMVMDDDKGSIELTIKDGKKELVAKNAKGDQIYSGPVNTPEERKALPADVRERLERLEDSTQFGFKPGGDFKTETKTLRARGQGVSLPQSFAPRAVPARQPLFF